LAVLFYYNKLMQRLALTKSWRVKWRLAMQRLALRDQSIDDVLLFTFLNSFLCVQFRLSASVVLARDDDTQMLCVYD